MNAGWAPIGAAIAVVVVVGTVSLVTRDGGGPPEPPLLRLAAGTTAGAAPQQDSARKEGKVGAPGSSFRLVGTLPDGPAEARAHTLPDGAATEDAVRALAKALGVTGAPVREGAAWRLKGLYVGGEAGRPWQLSTCGPDTAVSSDGPVGCASGGSGTGVAVAEPGTVVAEPGRETLPAVSPCPDNARCLSPEVVAKPPPPPPPQPQPQVAPDVLRTAAAPVLAGLGLTGATVRVEVYGSQGSVTADPVVDGRPTAGFATRLELDAKGTLLGASGYLAEPSRGASYPLVSAREAFDALPEQPQPLMPECEACPTPAPATVSGAQLGLLLTALQKGEAALLPAWLFTVQDWPMSLAQIAVQERYLAPPVEPTGKVVPPDQPSGARAQLGFDAAYATDDPKTVIVQYGDSGSCPHANVTHAVKESAESVVVLLEADAQPGDQACTADYRQVLVTVSLQAPLGGRVLLDAARGEEVALDRSCARPMANPPPPKDCTR